MQPIAKGFNTPMIQKTLCYHIWTVIRITIKFKFKFIANNSNNNRVLLERKTVSAQDQSEDKHLL